MILIKESTLENVLSVALENYNDKKLQKNSLTEKQLNDLKMMLLEDISTYSEYIPKLGE